MEANTTTEGGGGGGEFTTAASADDASTTPDPETVRIEFYRSYDVMTGVRIAATLGGFFSLMVLLVLYKSKCKTKALSDEQLAEAVEAAAVAEAAAEERELAAAAEGAFNAGVRPHGRHGPRRSLGNMSAPACVLSRNWRHSYSLEPSDRQHHYYYYYYYYQRGRSLPGSSLRFPGFASSAGSGSGGGGRGSVAANDDDDDDLLEETSEAAGADAAAAAGAAACTCAHHRFLEVPGAARRLSSITCSSSDSSYLERRGSAAELGLPAPPPLYRRRSRRASALQPDQPWDFYYPIDIQVIQPTPDVSPCGSERTLYAAPTGEGLCPLAHRLQTLRGPAPLASISSAAAPSLDAPDAPGAPDAPDADARSVGSDSVFLDDGELDTEDEVDGFSTDSEGEATPCGHRFLQVPATDAVRWARWGGAWGHWGLAPARRASAPGSGKRRRGSGTQQPPPARSVASLATVEQGAEAAVGDSCEDLKAPPRPPRPPRPALPLPPDAARSPSPSSPEDSSRGTALTPRPAPLAPADGRSWSQETLF